MALGAAAVVVALGLMAALASSRRAADRGESAGEKPGAAVKALQPSAVFLPLAGKLPSGASRVGFDQASADGRRAAQITTGQGKLGFRLAPDATRYGISAIVRLSGAEGTTLTPSLDGTALAPWHLREGWSLYASVVDAGSSGKGAFRSTDTHELLLEAAALPSGAAIQVESASIAPILDRVSFDTGPQSEGHWVDGFHRRERGAIWSRGLKSAIGVVLEPGAVPYRLKVRGRTLAGLGPLLLKARINDREVGSVEATTKVDDVAWAIPAGVLKSGANRIELEYPKTGQPAAFNPKSHDTRELAFRISSVELAPAD